MDAYPVRQWNEFYFAFALLGCATFVMNMDICNEYESDEFSHQSHCNGCGLIKAFADYLSSMMFQISVAIRTYRK